MFAIPWKSGGEKFAQMAPGFWRLKAERSFLQMSEILNQPAVEVLKCFPECYSSAQTNTLIDFTGNGDGTITEEG